MGFLPEKEYPVQGKRQEQSVGPHGLRGEILPDRAQARWSPGDRGRRIHTVLPVDRPEYPTGTNRMDDFENAYCRVHFKKRERRIK